MSRFEQPRHIRISSNGVKAEILLAPAVVLFGSTEVGKKNVLRAIASLMCGQDPECRDLFPFPSLISEERATYEARWYDTVVFGFDPSLWLGAQRHRLRGLAFVGGDVTQRRDACLFEESGLR